MRPDLTNLPSSHFDISSQRCRSRNLLLQARAQATASSAPASSACSPDYQHLERSTKRTDLHQSQLPLLPIPELSDSCSRYLDAVRPLVPTAEQLQDTERLVADFERNVGKQLDHELRKRSAAITDRTYFSDDWTESYLTHRDPLPIHMNPYMILKDDPLEEYNLQAIRASNLLVSALRYRRSLVDQCLEPEKIEMRPFQNLFSTTRIPKEARDELVYFEGSKHVVFLKHGQFYRLDVLDADGQLKPAEEIAAFVQNLNAMPAEQVAGAESITCFSAGDRQSWARARADLIKFSAENATNLEAIDSALIVVCLDQPDYEPSDLSSQSLGFLHGCYRPERQLTPTADFTLNRWFDKSVQLIVTGAGVAGVNFEHSWGDGVVVQSAFNKIYEDSVRNRFVSPYNQPSTGDVEPHRLGFTLDQRLRNDLGLAQQNFKQFAAPVQMTVVHYEQMNRQYLKERRISPDFVFQMAFQMANYKLFTNTGELITDRYHRAPLIFSFVQMFPKLCTNS